MTNLIAKVLVVSQAQNLNRLFDYTVPEELQTIIQVGVRVLVPFQNRQNLGFVWELAEESEFKDLKAIEHILDNKPLISNIQYELINWLADFYFCSRVDAVKLCLPPGTNFSREIFYKLALNFENLPEILVGYFPPADITGALQLISTGIKAEWNSQEWQKRFSGLPKVWDFLIQKKILTKNYRIAKPKTKAKLCKLYRWVALADGEQSLAALKVKNILQGSSLGMSAAELCAAAEISSTVLKRLLKEGQVSCCETVTERIPVGFSELVISKDIKLSPEQFTVYQHIITQNSQNLFLLHGITGSGKTEIYFEIAAGVINRGGQVLYLVPEISLTPQTLERARNRFGDQIALLHSNMSDGERYDQWYRVKNSQARFVLGARSAVFAPFEKLELIIVDEEHETTYKQEDNPRYHIRQVVEKLAELTGAKIIFGSATPSIESFYFAQTGKYQYLQLKQRYNQNPLPEVTIVDMREELQNGNKNILSQQLFNSISDCLANKEQVILLLNRRGHSTFVLCRDCGHALRCSACDVALTYHFYEKTLRCHYCDYRQPIPETCPECHSVRIRYFGHGTQKLEEELAVNFPQARLIRMDVDSTTKKGAHHQIYRQLTAGTVDILLGTQMIAKGLDLPKVTLVGVISADSTLNIPDFRAAERTFQLLTQVAGRTGRGLKRGRVIFQAYDISHYSLRLAKEHDYYGFYQEEIKHREELRYPPYSELVKIGFLGLKEPQVVEAAHDFYHIVKVLQESLADSGNSTYYIEVLGPGPNLIPKIQNNYRWQLLLKSNNQNWLELVVKKAWEKYNLNKHNDIKVIKDRNPYMVV